MSDWPSEKETPEGSRRRAFSPSFLRTQESRVWTPDQVRGDGLVSANQTTTLAIAMDESELTRSCANSYSRDVLTRRTLR